MRSSPPSGLGTTTTGVCDRGETARPDVVSARPRVTDGSREGIKGTEGAAEGSVWCDGFPACCRACDSGGAAATGGGTD